MIVMFEVETFSCISILSSACLAELSLAPLAVFLGDDLDGVAGPGLDVDPAIDVVDFDASSWLKLIGLAPFGCFAVLELGLDDIAALRNAEAGDEERKREDCRS